MVNRHYNSVIKNFWQDRDVDLVYQPSCLQRPYRSWGWPIRYPKVEWNERTLVVMHCQDFLTTNGTSCPELENIEQQFGPKSDRVIVVHWNYGLDRVYQGPIHLVYFPTHSYEILQNLRKSEYREWRNHLRSNRTLNWQCLNGQPRPHRRCVHDWIKSLPNGISSLYDIDPLPGHDYRVEYDWEKQGPELNEKNFIRLMWLYSNAKINVVTETHYSEWPGIITEKTVFALLAQQIPLVIGYRGIVADCKKIGFDMFEDLVNISYDSAEDQDRWRLALELNKNLLIDPPDLAPWRQRLQQQSIWISEQWCDAMVESVQQKYHQISKQLSCTTT